MCRTYLWKGRKPIEQVGDKMGNRVWGLILENMEGQNEALSW